MFKGKTLVGLGCSHTSGSYGKEFDCTDLTKERSWVKKLEQIGNFKDSVNLGIPGGSNHRSERVLFEFLKNNTHELVVIFTITELSRFETFNVLEPVENFKSSWDIGYQGEGTWKLLPDLEFPLALEKLEYLKYHYTLYSNDQEDVKIINRKVLLIHALLKSMNIEHYFLEMLAPPYTIQRNQLNFKIPFIEFKSKKNTQINARDWVIENFMLGPCGDWDHDASLGLAEYMFNYFKDNRYE
jgi:hypothetical protein